MTTDYSLILSTSAITGNEPSVIMPITSLAQHWNRSRLWKGGSGSGYFTVYGSRNELRRYFETWLTLNVHEEVGGIKTWNGFIVGLNLQIGSIPRGLFYNRIWNKVAAIYYRRRKITDWQSDTHSQNKYGVRELIITVPSRSLADAERQREFTLWSNSWPQPSALWLRPGEQRDHLIVYVSGYWNEVDNHITPTLTSEPDISTALTTIIDASASVTARNLAANSNACDDIELLYQRSWYAINHLLNFTDENNNPMRGYIDEHRQFRYKVASTTPTAYLRNGLAYHAAGDSIPMNPRLLDAGYYRDAAMHQLQGKLPDSLWAGQTDILINELWVTETNVLYIPQLAQRDTFEPLLLENPVNPFAVGRIIGGDQYTNNPTDRYAIHSDIDAEISELTEKSSPDSGDWLIIESAADGNAKRKAQAGRLPSTDTDAIHDNIPGEITAITEKTTPASGDWLLLESTADGDAKRKVQAGNLPATDADAIHDDVAGEIAAITEKTSPANGDVLLLEDSADSYNKKRVQIGNLPASGSGSGSSAWPVMVVNEDQTAATNGTKTNFVLANTYRAESTMVFLAGTLQRPSDDYTEDTSRDAITFASAPASSDLLISYIVE